MRNERIEPLGGGICIAVSKEHGFGTDAVLLAHFASPKTHETVCDLGTGCGIIPMLWRRENKPKYTAGLEISSEAASLWEKTIKINNIGSDLELFKGDLRNCGEFLPFYKFDLVTCNPPYKKDGAGIKSPEQLKAQAFHEVSCSIEDIIKASFKLLRDGGRLCVCQRPERLTDVLLTMRENNIEPKKLRFVQHRVDCAPSLFLVEGRKGAKSGGLTTLRALIIESEYNEYSEDIREIYKLYREARLCREN